MLLEREYRSGMFNNTIRKACSILRRQAINFIARTPSKKRPVFVANFDPHLPDIRNITFKHWRAIKRIDPHMAEVFPKPPLIDVFNRPGVAGAVL